MDNSTKEDNVRREISKIELKARRITFWTTVVVLISTMIPAIAAIFTYQEVKGFIAGIVEKPFEGVWDYSSDYERYYDEKDIQKVHGEGRAIILWKYGQNRYDMDLSYAIKRDHVEIPLLVSAVKGELTSDASGWPSQQPFVMDFKLLQRLHYELKVHHLRKYQFKNCTYTKSVSGDRPETFTCVFETDLSKSIATFTKQAGIH